MVGRKIKYKRYQKWFCKQFIKRSSELKNYKYFLKHITKKSPIHFSFRNVIIYDVLDNDGMNSLMKKIHKLKKNKRKYDVDTVYKYNRLKKLNYISNNLTGTIIGKIAEIKIKDSKWLYKIFVSYTYINSSQCIVKYNFTFKKSMNTYLQIHYFVVDELMKIKKEFYFHTYADKKIIINADYVRLRELDEIFFADILQGYVCKLFYTKYGKGYKLPVEYCLKLPRYNFKKAKKLNSFFLCDSYKKEKKHMIISTLNYDRFELTNCCSGKYFPEPMLYKYFSNFTTEIYYKVFYEIEIKELEKRMRKYLNSRKHFVAAKDIKWVINKIRYIKENESKLNYAFSIDNKAYVEHLIEWEHYFSGRKKANDFVNYPEYTNKFLNIYEQNLEFLRSIGLVQNNVVIIIIGVATFISTIIGIILSVIIKG